MPQTKPITPIPQKEMIDVENNPRPNSSGSGSSKVSLVQPANDEKLLTDVNPNETDGGSFKEQGWIPMVARRKDRMSRLALLDVVPSTPNAEEQANGIGVPTESLDGNFRGIRPEQPNYEMFTKQEKKRLPKLTNPQISHRDLDRMGIEDMTL